MNAVYLTIAEVLNVHRVLVERYGGTHGLRDMGTLEAAVFRPQSGYYADTVEEAAALLESMLINHPFLDGNKRTAFACCDVFLRMNGLSLNADPDWLFQRIMEWLEISGDRFQRMTRDLRGVMQRGSD